MCKRTRLLLSALLMGVAAVPLADVLTRTPSVSAAQPRQAVFVALYERGPAWDDSMSALEQAGIGEHMQFLRANSETLIAAAPFQQGLAVGASDRTVGMVIVLGATQEGAERLIASDPAIVARLMRADVRRWLVERVRAY